MNCIQIIAPLIMGALGAKLGVTTTKILKGGRLMALILGATCRGLLMFILTRFW